MSAETAAGHGGAPEDGGFRLVRPPLPQSFVVLAPLLAGEYPGGPDEREARRRIRRVMREGPDCFLDLTEDGELEPYAHLLPGNVRHVRLPLAPGAVPSPNRMRMIVEAIDELRGHGWSLYVHDARGTGRAATAMGCWLAETRIVDEPLAFLDRERSHILGPWKEAPATAEQRAFVRGWTRGERPWTLREIVERSRVARSRIGGEPHNHRERGSTPLSDREDGTP